MSQRKARETEDALSAWIADRDRLGDYQEYQNGMQVNRRALIDEGVLKRSQLSVNGNPRLKDLLVEAERRWYGQKEETLESHKQALEASERRYERNASLVSKLQDKLVQVQAELRALQSENERLKKELGIERASKADIVTRYAAITSWD